MGGCKIIKRTVYRGVSYSESKKVLKKRRYVREELREFQGGVKAKSAFGEGIYLINDIEIAAHYAFCHAEQDKDEYGVVFKQTINFESPFILNENFTEERLRRNALNWKYTESQLERFNKRSGVQRENELGGIVKDYLIAHNYDSVVYHLNDEIIYYISYYQQQQISELIVDFEFNICQLNSHTVHCLRNEYKKETLPNFK